MDIAPICGKENRRRSAQQIVAGQAEPRRDPARLQRGKLFAQCGAGELRHQVGGGDRKAGGSALGDVIGPTDCGRGFQQGGAGENDACRRIGTISVAKGCRRIHRRKARAQPVQSFCLGPAEAQAVCRVFTAQHRQIASILQRALLPPVLPDVPGVEVVAQLVRHYPLGEHFAHSVGYVGRINEQELKKLDPVNYSGTHHIGKTGIERFYEAELHGQVGYEEVETNARGRILRVLKRTDPVAGKDIHLTIDSRLQASAEAALAGKRGALVAIQPSTGDVLAMVSVPGFDPNPFVTGIGFNAYKELRDSIDRPLYNRVLRGL